MILYSKKKSIVGKVYSKVEAKKKLSKWLI